MSRIDEALRRAGANTHATSREGGGNGNGVFSSPWTFGPEAVHAAGPVPQRPRSRSLAEPAPSGQVSSWRFREFSPEWRDRLIISPSVDPILVEEFRRLAAMLHQAQTTNGLKTVMVTSAASGDGKTLTSVNLSLVLSGSYGRRVLLIDADLRRPSIQSLSQMPDAPGLGDALKATGEQKLSIVPLTDNLVLLPAGPAQSDPMSALTSPRMHRILEEAGERFDWVIVDAPPVGPVADATLLAERIGAIIFVIRAGQTPYPAAQRAIEALGRDRILGIVLNAVPDAGGAGNYYGEYLSPQA
jgi:capsular exopolysaccharide synthesis family protein